MSNETEINSGNPSSQGKQPTSDSKRKPKKKSPTGNTGTKGINPPTGALGTFTQKSPIKKQSP